MKKRGYLSLLGVIFLLSSAIFYPVLAAEVNVNSGEREVIVSEDIDDDYYVAGDERVVIEGNVNGDLIVAGGIVDVEGDVQGNLYAVGGMVTIDGTVEGDVYTAGGQLEMNGAVNGSVFAGGGTININGDIAEDLNTAGGQVNVKGTIGDDLRAAGGYLVIDGTVGDDVMAGAGVFELTGDVKGDVRVGGDDVTIRSEMIGGDLIITGDEDKVSISDDTAIGGEYKLEKRTFSTKYKGDNESLKDTFAGAGALGFVFKTLVLFVEGLGFILLGWLAFKVAPVKMDATVSKMNSLREKGMSFAVGFIAFPTTLLLALLLTLILVGWQTVMALFALATLAMALAVPVAGVSLGRWVLTKLGRKENLVLPLFVGVTIIQLVRIVPCLGGLTIMLVYITAIGAMLRMQYEKYQAATASTNVKKKSKK